MILVVGLDGFDYRWRAPLVKQGYQVLPMDSPHCLSGPAWTSIFSGLRAETHGIPHVPGAAELAAGFGKQKPRWVWDHFGAAGLVSVIVNAPFTYPPGLVNRLLVSGYPTAAQNRTFPKRAAADFPWRILDLYYSYADKASWDFLAVPDEEMLETCKKNRWHLAHKFLCAAAEGQRDLAVFCLTDLDQLAHYAYRTFRKRERRKEVLADIMALLERLETRFYPEWTFVVSDHGLDLTEKPREEDGWGLCHGPDRPESRTGIFAYKGAEARALPAGSKVALEDVAPTLMYLADITPVGPLDGKAQTEISQQGYEDAAETWRQLQALWYVEAAQTEEPADEGAAEPQEATEE